MIENKRTRSRDYLLFLIKLIIGIGLLAILYANGALQFGLMGDLFADKFGLAVAVVATASIFPLAAWRWYLLLSVTSFSISFKKTNGINYQSAFIGMYLPGAIGADVAKLAISNNHGPGNLATLVATVLVDRLLGMIALLFLGLVAVLWANLAVPDFVHASSLHPWLKELHLFIGFAILLSFLGLIGLLALLAVSQLAYLKTPFLHRLKLDDVFVKLRNGILLYRNHKIVLLQGLGISVLAHLLDLAALVVIANMLLALSVSPAVYSLAGVLSAIVSIVPLTPGGIGVAEGAFSQLMDWFAPMHAGAAFATVYLAHRVIRVIVLMPGALSLLKRRG